ncbi:M23 family metallopeptidase [Paenibacillus sp. GCM10012307]|uniref:M23 family metallopeptidase n=1 Tax=Paenibacillus roseus TaxID=2798579 RepID=A0A934IY56_9BACL|nr:M23 family metallopeptidase [Paenibacillus roseus]
MRWQPQCLALSRLATWRNISRRLEVAKKIHIPVAVVISLSLLLGICTPVAYAQSPSENSQKDIFKQRRELLDTWSTLSGIPWFHLAAIDQYERTLNKALPKKRTATSELLGIYIPKDSWSGPLNPDQEDSFPASIGLFHGIGQDGNGDGQAQRDNEQDVLHTVTRHYIKYGPGSQNFARGVWDYYHNSRAVQRVMQFSKLYEHFGRLDLFEHTFPLPTTSDYSYQSTWGMKRGWGGRRIHEGTDIFASYGVPVRSTSYGVVEIKGWNRYGGWRIGIRDIDNIYHYYAHLSGFEKDIKVGDIVTPGQTVGWVGSSGYGKPGTQGKFPPHLHYGIYRDRGLIEWAFDPYPLLRYWEQSESKRLRQKK